MQNDEKRIAVFIDFENVAMGVRESKYGDFNIELVLKRLVEKGKIMVKRAYSDWHRYSEFKRAFHQAAIELIDVPQTRYSGKNSADIRIVVDALDLSYQKEHIDTFVLVSGDSDFSPLVSKLRENGRYVIGMGVKQSSSDLLINNCDEFIFYEDLVRPTAAVPVVDPKLHLSPKKAEAIRLVLETFQALQREGKEVIYGSMIKQTLIRKLPSFNETYYGYPMFSRLLEDAAENKLLKLTKDQKSGGYIVTLPSESPVPAAVQAAEGAQEASQGTEAAVEGVPGAGGPAPVPMEPRDRFRRGRWERGRSYRGPSRSGDTSQSIRPFPAPANPAVEPEVVDAAARISEPLAAPQQPSSSETAAYEASEVPAALPPGATAEPALPPVDSVQAVPEGPLASPQEVSAAAPPTPLPGKSRRGGRSQRSDRAAPRRRPTQPAAVSSSTKEAGSQSESGPVTASRKEEAGRAGELSSGSSQSGHVSASGEVPKDAPVAAASKAHASPNRKGAAGRRSSGSRGRRRKSGSK
jgi:uncharacterized protein (TIGR00288 family)